MGRCRRRSRSRSCRASLAHSSARISSSPWRPMQHDLVADRDGVVAAVDHQLVHRDRADDRAGACRRSARSLRCPTGCGGRRRRSRSAPSPPSPRPASVWRSPYDSRSPAASRLTKETRALQRQRRPQRRGQLVERGPGRDAVHGDAGADERAPGVRAGERGGRVGGVDRHVVERSAARRGRRRTVRSCSSVYGSSELVGDGEVGEHAGEAQRRGAGRRCGRRAPATSAGRAPTRCIPVSTLRWTRCVAAPLSTTAAARRSMPSAVRHRGDEAVGDEVGRRLAGGCSLSTRIGASIPAWRRATPSDDQGDAQAGGAGRQRGPADRDRAVAVAVGLDDGPHLGRGGGDAQQADVVGDGVEVDLGPRPARRRGRVRRVTTSTSSTARRDRRRRRSLATSPAAGSGDAAAAWSQAPAGGGVERPAIPLGQQRADHPRRARRRCRRWPGAGRRW